MARDKVYGAIRYEEPDETAFFELVNMQPKRLVGSDAAALGTTQECNDAKGPCALMRILDDNDAGTLDFSASNFSEREDVDDAVPLSVSFGRWPNCHGEERNSRSGRAHGRKSASCCCGEGVPPPRAPI